MKLPIILSAMIAALAIPGSLASEATDETKTEAPAEAEKPAMEEKKPGKKKKAQGMHHPKGKHHHKGHHHKDSGGNSPSEPYKEAYDGPNLRGADGDVSADMSPKAGEPVNPGHKVS